MKELEAYLNDYGLTPPETRIYLTLLEIGSSTVLELSKKTKLNRTTTHIYIDKLKDKGLITELQVGNRRKIIPEPPEKLKLVIENEKVELRRKEEGIESLINKIYDTITNAKSSSDSSVKYYEGINSISALYDEILQASEIRTYANASEILDIFPDNTVKFIEAVKKGHILWDLMVETPQAHEFMINCNYPNYFHKYFPKSLKINSMDYLIYGDSIAIIQSRPKLFGIVIKNKYLAENARLMYDLLWGLLPN